MTHMGPTNLALVRLSGKGTRELHLKKVTSLTTREKLNEEGEKALTCLPGMAGLV